MSIIIYDLSTLHYQWDFSRTTLKVLSARIELLASVDCVPGISEREAAFRGLDAVLSSARITRTTVDGKVRCRVALYNPYTAQISFKAVPDTEVYTNSIPLEIDVNGSLGTLAPDAILLGSQEVSRINPEYKHVSAALAAHRI